MTNATDEDADFLEEEANKHEEKAKGYQQAAGIHSNKLIASYLQKQVSSRGCKFLRSTSLASFS